MNLLGLGAGRCSKTVKNQKFSHRTVVDGLGEDKFPEVPCKQLYGLPSALERARSYPKPLRDGHGRKARHAPGWHGISAFREESNHPYFLIISHVLASILHFRCVCPESGRSPNTIVSSRLRVAPCVGTNKWDFLLAYARVENARPGAISVSAELVLALER